MKIIVTGGAGFVGRKLCERLVERKHEVAAIGRSPAPGPGFPAGAGYLAADATLPGPWQREVESADAVVNLAGVSIFSRWTRARKQQIYESRVLTTKNLADAIGAGGPGILISGSATGYYGVANQALLSEDAAPGDDFLAKVCRDWEAAAVRASAAGARVAIARFGVILDGSGGALGAMIPAFKLFVGGKLGSGRQWFSWLHLADLLGALTMLVEDGGEGPYNFSAPNPVTNAELAAALGRALGRPSWLPVPAAALKLALGEFGAFLLEGQRAYPRRLLDAGFKFAYPTIEQALREVISKEG